MTPPTLEPDAPSIDTRSIARVAAVAGLSAVAIYAVYKQWQMYRDTNMRVKRLEQTVEPHMRYQSAALEGLADAVVDEPGADEQEQAESVADALNDAHDEAEADAEESRLVE
jgi:hypothetical protein